MNSCSRNPDDRSKRSCTLLLARLLAGREANDSSRNKFTFPLEGV